ncbi:MAG: AsnC family transcriptional regulator [Nitrososphaerota archaeon]|nr:AsnC family transcriptional regulator [Nitrososphaerota archaeon]
MDETDIKICQLLLGNSRLPYDYMAGKLNLSINAVHKRVKGLVDVGTIRRFVAHPSLLAVNAINIWIFGRSRSTRILDLHLRLKNNDSTYWVAYSGGAYLYVGAYLRDISELESYSDFVKTEAEMEDLTIGILPSFPKRTSDDEFHRVDYQIISSLHNDSRKPLTDVASELGVTVKTVRSRLERMIERNLIEITLEWYPDASDDIVALLHLTLKPEAKKVDVSNSLIGNFSPNLLFTIPFGNIPNTLVSFAWTNTMRQLETLRAKTAELEGVDSVNLNVLQIGYSYDTWRDKTVLERCKV